MQFTEEWLEEYQKRTGIRVQMDNQQPSEKPKRSKYGNVKTAVDGQTFDSKHEAARYAELKLLRQAKEIAGFCTQVTFHLAEKVDYRADFVVLYPDGHFEVEDAKSSATSKDKVFRIKKKLMLEVYGIEIKEV